MKRQAPKAIEYRNGLECSHMIMSHVSKSHSLSHVNGLLLERIRISVKLKAQ